MGCVVKEEVHIPFDEADNFLSQQVLYQEASADSTTGDYNTEIDKNATVKIKAEPLPINIKEEFSDNMIHEGGDLFIKKEPTDETTAQSVSVNLMETEDPQEDLMDTSSDEEDKVDNIAINIELISKALKLKAKKLPVEQLPVAKDTELAKEKTTSEKIIEVNKPVERMRLRERKVRNPVDAEKKLVETKKVNGRQLRERKSKTNTTTTEKSQKRKNNCTTKSRFSPLIRQQCPNCELNLEKESQVIQKCFNCQTPFVYICVKCDKKYDRKDSMKKHLDTKCHPRKIHSCQKCEYTSAKYAHVKRHVLNIHKAKIEKLSNLIRTKNVRALF